MLHTVVTYHVERLPETPPDVAIERVLEQVRLADELRYDIAWFAEHHFGGHRSVMPAPLLFALHAASETRSIKVGTSVVCLPLHHPVDIAEQVATADVLTKGRMSVGFGSGSAPIDFTIFDSDQAKRHARFEEQLDIVKLCWAGEPFTFQGACYHLDQMQSVPTPVQSPIELAWIGASSEPTARLAGKLGFGLQLPRGRTAESYVPIIDAYREAWTGAGYPGDQSRVSIARCLYVGESDHEALASMEPATRMFAQRWQPNLAKDLTMRDLVDQMNFCVGGPDSVIQHVQHLQQVTGFTHLSIQPTWDSVPQAAALASLRRFARDVRPNLSLLV